MQCDDGSIYVLEIQIENNNAKLHVVWTSMKRVVRFSIIFIECYLVR